MLNETSRLSDRVTLFAGSVESSSLYLLRAIEKTVDSMQLLENLARSISSNALAVADEIFTSIPQIGKFVDPDHVAVDKLESSLAKFDEDVPKIERWKQSVDKDDELQAHHREILQATYDSYLGTLEALVESLKILRATIIRHDLAAEDIAHAKRYNSADELIAALHSGT